MNSSSQVFITSKKSFPRLHIFTGKGGTGKTTLSYSLTQALKAQKKKVLYISFDQNPDATACRKIGIPFLAQIQKDITLDYVAQKLGSRILANWILETAFFKALYQMLPGVLYLILMSDILKRLSDDKKLHIVLDLPSTGHALTLFEAPLNFKTLFEKGPLFNDLQVIQAQLLDSELTKLYITSLATELAFNEAEELQEELKALDVLKSEIVFNNTLAALNLEDKKLPPILKKKIKQERKVLELGKDHDIHTVFPFIPSLTLQERINALALEWETV